MMQPAAAPNGLALSWWSGLTLTSACFICVAIMGMLWGAAPQISTTLTQAEQLMRDNNFAEASQKFREVLAATETTAEQVVAALDALRRCQQQLGLQSQLDQDLSLAVSTHADKFLVLDAAATHLTEAQHWGIVADGQFSRGFDQGVHRNGSQVDVLQLDRLQALKWRQRALELAQAEAAPASAVTLARLHFKQAELLRLGRGPMQWWLLQELTDLADEPDYADLNNEPQHVLRPAPVEADGAPVLYAVPASWEAARNDGERYRWSLAQAAQAAEVRPQALFAWGRFQHEQFSVDTLQQDAWLFRRTNDDGSLPEQGVAAIHTLEETETIAKLASGIERFTLEDEFNPIRIFESVVALRGDHAEQAAWQLVQTFLNRRQYPRAAAHLESYLERWGDEDRGSKRTLLDNIRLPRITIDPTPSQLAGRAAELSVLFRNATQVSFTARPVDIEKILRDTKIFYRTLNPQQPHRGFGNLQRESPPDLNSPASLFDQVDIRDYVGDEVAQWEHALEPRPNHWDRRQQLKTPLSRAGLYLIEARASSADLDAVHKVRCLVWLSDLALVEKPAEGDKSWLSLVSAATGQPIAGANIELFGWGYEQSPNATRARIKTQNSSVLTDATGMAEVAMPQDLQWFCAARTSQGQLALLGFHNLWRYGHWPQAYGELKAYGVSDRPLYRPGEKVKAKFWLGYATYGDAESLRAVDRRVTVIMHDPQGLEVAKQQLRTDAFGGCELEMQLASSAPLGRYNFQVQLEAAESPAEAQAVPPGRRQLGGRPGGRFGRGQPSIASGGYGGGVVASRGKLEGQLWANTSLSVRVEEYRKPEFEVKIRAPEKPVALGETIKARISAQYYFGAPVTEAEVTVRVQRSTHREDYYPWFPFDWCYGPGYWWFAEDYSWYPGWRSWHGCLAPMPPWWPGWGFEPPELVLEQELKLDATGNAELEIDTALAKAVYGAEDHKYSISVEVRDASRRTITTEGSVIAAREPFKIYSWVDRGYYTVGQPIQAHFQARQLDGTAVTGSGQIDLLKISYDQNLEPQESLVASFPARTDDAGNVSQVMEAQQAGQFRVRLRLTDAAQHEVEGGYVFTVRGPGTSGDDFRYNALELIPDKAHYAPGETVRLQLASSFDGARVALLVRPSANDYAKPQWVVLEGKSSIVDIPVTEQDQPNFFVEAYTVFDGEFHQEVREIIVPPADKVLNVEVAFDKEEYLPGEEAQVEVKVTDATGKPVQGSCVVAAYDRALETLASDVLPPDIREFFWKWERHHQPQSLVSLDVVQQPIHIPGQPHLQPLGIFGGSVADDPMSPTGMQIVTSRALATGAGYAMRGMGGMVGGGMGGEGAMFAAPMAASADLALEAADAARGRASTEAKAAAPEGSDAPRPTIRQDFADSALWLASLNVDSQGVGRTQFKMPENLTSWQLRTWSMADQTRVGSARQTAVTRQPLMIRLQTPRFLVERDEVVLSGIVHNDLNATRRVNVSLEIDGETQLALISAADREQSVEIAAGAQARVDWRVRALAAGTVKVRAIATTDDAADAMQLELPIAVNGILKMDAWAGTVRQGQESATITLNIPEQRRVEQSNLVVRLSPSLAASMIDALPYLADYPYGCTEQTLNRFLPTVITQRTLQRMNIDLARLKEQRNNLNAQELGDPTERRERWKRFDQTAVFDEELVADMAASGVARLTDMQHADGGWGWFSGTQEQSAAHTTAIVVRGLMIAEQNNVAIVPDVLQRGVAWLAQYQAGELEKLQRAAEKVVPYKQHPDNLDALVFHVLTLANQANPVMQEILYAQREHLSVYGKALLAWAVHRLDNPQQTDMLRRNIEQFLVQDSENESAYLRGESSWWYWYGSEIEANAIYLKLLAAVDPQGPTAPRVVKYLLNNRKHATYWNSTRDTALVVEAFADYLAASGELQTTMQTEVFISGKRLGTIEFTPENLFTANNSMEISGAAVPAGTHQLEIRRRGGGNLYWNAYVTNFTLEEEIAAAGLEVKVERRYYHLRPESAELLLPNERAGVVNTQKSKLQRTPIEDLQEVPSGELVEVELLIESKNDYEYLLIEDPKAAGLETVETQSGYFYSAGLSVYRELRDRHVGLCIRWLPRGTYSIRYQLRSEAPGVFTALPTIIQGMYAPELRGNSTDFDVRVVDQ